jgi:hypothetical protein
LSISKAKQNPSKFLPHKIELKYSKIEELGGKRR